MHKISVVIITFNEENRIRPTLESIKWSDEIIIIDSNSTDRTIDICEEYKNCKVYVQPFLGYGAQKKFAVEKASYDWIFSLDADEVVTNTLRDEIIAILSLPIIATDGFYVPITLVFMNRVFNYGSENKFPHLRLFNKNKGDFNTLKLHESVKVEGTLTKLRNEIFIITLINSMNTVAFINMKQ
jgi:glycosyltransferase involved in cell wall biosynthesis